MTKPGTESTPASRRVFLTAEWRSLLMLNYEVDPRLLQPLVPRGTELDTWNGKYFLSVVGFLFLNTRVRGISFPFHSNFEEVNLRFYVRRKVDDGWRRGVTFIREIVPRRAVTLIANALYNERYMALAMRHHVVMDNGMNSVEYSWHRSSRWEKIKAQNLEGWHDLEEGSQGEFITEHYWGYTAQRDGGTIEYQVAHPRWRVRSALRADLDCDVSFLYGPEYCDYLQGTPASAFVADGSAVKVYRGGRI